MQKGTGRPATYGESAYSARGIDLSFIHQSDVFQGLKSEICGSTGGSSVTSGNPELGFLLSGTSGNSAKCSDSNAQYQAITKK